MRWLAAAFVAVLAVVGWAQYRTSQLSSAVQALEDKIMQTLTASWKDADGVTHIVSTPRNEGESAADHSARHAESVKALQAQFPPVK